MSGNGDEFRRMLPSFWDGETGRALQAQGPEAVVAAMFLVTNRLSNPIGHYMMPAAYLAAHWPEGLSGSPIEGASKGLRRASEGGFCLWDEPTGWVLVPGAAAIQIRESLAPGDKRVQWVRRMVDACRKSPWQWHFLQRYREAFHLQDVEEPEAPSKGHRSPIEARPRPRPSPSPRLEEVGASPPSTAKAPKAMTAKDLRDREPNISEAASVFLYWVDTMEKAPGSTRLTKARHRLITARQKEGYSEEQMRQAIDGCRASPHHRGENETGTVYDSLELILRSGAKVEQFMGYAHSGPADDGGWLREARKLNGGAIA